MVGIKREIWYDRSMSLSNNPLKLKALWKLPNVLEESMEYIEKPKDHNRWPVGLFERRGVDRFRPIIFPDTGVEENVAMEQFMSKKT